jgi:hypothetical protein
MITSIKEYRKYMAVNEDKSPHFDFIESYAKEHGIKYYVHVNRYTKSDEVVLYGSAAEFFKQKDAKLFIQQTEPTGFNAESTGRLNIGVAIFLDKQDTMGNRLSTSVLYDVNYDGGVQI